MQLLINESENTYIIHLKAEKLNTQNAPDLKAQLLLLIGDEKHRNIILDLAAVNYVDSSGLGALLLGLRQAKANDKRFALIGTQSRVTNLIHIAHLDDVLLTFKDEVEAIAHLNRMAE